jgi:hypothetical protein
LVRVFCGRICVAVEFDGSAIQIAKDPIGLLVGSVEADGLLHQVLPYL